MWRRASLSIISSTSSRRRRWISTQPWASRILKKDEGDWSYSSEWWETTPHSDTVLRSTSEHGNGVVSVVAHPCSTPDAVQWTSTERWLQQRYAEIHPENKNKGQFRVLGYQWRVLRFNDFTRQSAVKIMAACQTSDPSSVHIMQQPHILAVPYLKSMISVGMAALASCSYDLRTAVHGEKPMHILCIGHGGGSLPLFLASKIQGAIIHVVELDPLVVSASIEAMGFPAFAKLKPSGERAIAAPKMIDEVLWKGTHERLFIYESDAAKFILNPSNVYDLVFIDAYDGDDIFPHKLWDPNGQFLQNLRNRLHPEHGTVVVNLHADSDIIDSDEPNPVSSQHVLPMGKYVSRICQAYKEALVGNCSKERGLAFAASVPWLCNSSLVVCRGFGAGTEKVQCSSSSEAELMAIQLGLQQAKNQNFEKILLVSDNLAGVSEINGEGKHLHWSLRGRINSIKQLANSFDYCCIVFAPRNYITAAHFLATKTRNGSSVILKYATNAEYSCNSFVSEQIRATLLEKGMSDINNLCKYFCFT